MKVELTQGDQDGLAKMFLVFWGAIVLNPIGRKIERDILANCGFIERRGKLKLTLAGERVIAKGKQER